MKRKVPAILVAAFAIDLLFALANIGVQLGSSPEIDWEGVDRWSLVENGAWIMTLVLMIAGFRDLADRVWGTANRMAKCASGLAIALLGFEILFMLISAFDLVRSQDFWTVHSYLFWGLFVAMSVVLFLGGDRKGLAAAGLALTLIARLPPHAARPIYAALAHGYRSGMALRAAFGAVHTIGMLMLVAAIVAGVPAHAPQRAITGFRRAGAGFTLRLVASIGSMLLVLLAFGARGDAGYGLFKLVIIGGLFVNTLAAGMIGLGALSAARSSLEGIAKPVAIASAAASLWCAGAMLDQLPHYYQMLYGRGHGKDALEALELTLPIVGALATAVLATVIGGLGRARGDDGLARAGTSAGVGYLALTLAAIGLQNYMFEKVHDKSSAVAIMLIAAAAGLAAQVIMRRLCRRAADAVEAAPGLPAARINP